jgi:DNA-binding IclR family transcriptional regulator
MPIIRTDLTVSIMAVKGSPMPQKSEGSARKAEGMGGLAKGLAIVEAFSAHSVMSVADAARAAGATRASARRCLLTLTELGYLEHSGREFRPLTRLRRLGGLASRRDQLALLAQPLLSHARDELAESVSLAVLDNDTALFIARAEAEHIVSTGVRVGARLPVYCSATGRAHRPKTTGPTHASYADDDIRIADGDQIGSRKTLCRQRRRTRARPPRARGAGDGRKRRNHCRGQRKRRFRPRPQRRPAEALRPGIAVMRETSRSSGRGSGLRRCGGSRADVFTDCRCPLEESLERAKGIEPSYAAWEAICLSILSNR